MKSLAMKSLGRTLGIIALVAIIAIALMFAYDKFLRPNAGDPLGTTVTALSKQNKLVVFSAQVVAVVNSTDSRALGLLQSQQTAIIPGQVEYYVDLSKLTRDDVTWNADTQNLTITLPPLMIGAPNLSENRAQYYRKGILITDGASDALYRGNSQAAMQEARKQANNPFLVRLASTAAKEAVSQNLTVPFQAAGYENVKVAARFANEGAAP